MAEQPPQRRQTKPARQAIEDHAPWRPSHWDPADAAALQALVRGDCPVHLQQRAINFIVHTLCGTYDLSYRFGPDGERDTAFAEGKRWVGLQIVKLLKAPAKPDGEQR